MTEQDGCRVVDVAREWIGTPYVHQASCRGGGADCLGLIRGVWRELYGTEPERPPAYSRDWSEASGDEALWRAASRHLIRKPASQTACLGDVLLFRMRCGAVAKHLGIQSAIGAQPKFLHAYSGHGVVESAFDSAWNRRLVARFAFPKETT